MTNRSPHRGFSLVELMVTVAVLAILTGVAAPNMIDFIDKRRIISQAEAISELMQLARSEAIKHSSDANPKTVSATITPTAPWFVGLSNTGTTACTNSVTVPCTINQAGTDVTRVVSATECPSCTMTAPAAQAVVVFDLRGVVTNGGQTITLQSPRGKQMGISVSLIGRITTCSPNGSVAGYPTSC